MALLYVELLGPDLFWEKYLEISGRSRVLSSQIIDQSGSIFSKGTVGLQIESEDLYKKENQLAETLCKLMCFSVQQFQSLFAGSCLFRR
jgi:hypothetical protein